jgi:hypothetical protein
MTELGGRYRVRRLVVAIAMAAGIQLIDGAQTLALAHGDDRGLRAVAFVFVGAANDCDPAGYPAGSNIATSAWLRGMGPA